jgi:hypothetical protein
MKLPKILSLSTDPNPSTLRDRARVLQLSGFDVVSVTSAAQAELEITMGQCGVFVSCPLLSDASNQQLFKMLKYYCPEGITVFVMKDGSRSSVYRPQAEILIHMGLTESLPLFSRICRCNILLT